MNTHIRLTVLLFLTIATIISSCQKKKSGIFTDTQPKLTETTPSVSEIKLSGNLYVVTNIKYSISNENIRSIKWDFGDDSTSTEISPQHSYYQPREYTITAVVQTKDSMFTLTKVVNVSLGTERLNKIRDWHIKYIFLDSSVRHNGPNAPNPTKVVETDTSFQLDVISDYEIFIPHNNFYPERWNFYATYYYTDTLRNYIWYRVDLNEGGFFEVVHYYKSDSITLYRNQIYYNNKTRVWDRYYGLYHTK